MYKGTRHPRFLCAIGAATFHSRGTGLVSSLQFWMNTWSILKFYGFFSGKTWIYRRETCYDMRGYEQLNDFALPHISKLNAFSEGARCITAHHLESISSAQNVSCGRFARVLMHKRRQEWGVSERNRPPLNWRCVCDSYPIDSFSIQLLKKVAGATVFSKIGVRMSCCSHCAFCWLVRLVPQMLIMLESLMDEMCAKALAEVWQLCTQCTLLDVICGMWNWRMSECITTIAQQRGYICCLVMVRWSLLTFDQLYDLYVFLISWLWDYSIWNNQYLGSLFTFLVSPATNDFCILKMAPKQQEFIFPFRRRWLDDSLTPPIWPWRPNCHELRDFFTSSHWTHLQIPQKHPTCTTAVLVSFFWICTIFFLG